MRSKSLLLSVAVFLAAATPSIVFDASRAQSTDSGSEVAKADISGDSEEVVDPGEDSGDTGEVEEVEEV